jgi:hypothetical protein
MNWNHMVLLTHWTFVTGTFSLFMVVKSPSQDFIFWGLVSLTCCMLKYIHRTADTGFCTIWGSNICPWIDIRCAVMQIEQLDLFSSMTIILKVHQTDTLTIFWAASRWRTPVCILPTRLHYCSYSNGIHGPFGTELLVVVCGQHVPLTLTDVTFIYDKPQSKLFTDQTLIQLKKWRKISKDKFPHFSRETSKCKCLDVPGICAEQKVFPASAVIAVGFVFNVFKL